MADTVIITTHDLEPAVRLRDAFNEEGVRVELLTTEERIADVNDPALLILTGGLNGKRSRRLLEEAAELEHFPVMGLSDSPVDRGADTRRIGVTELFSKPIEPGEVALVGRRLLERRRLRQVTGIVGEAEAIREVLERVVRIAPVSSTVLITGESGTGKELVARGLHALSARRHQKFIPANVAALPATLLESELFGHEKGAFTGAVAQRKGLFELANRGTLFLDEIGEMPEPTQTKLLRVLEERRFMRVGGETPIEVDVRVVAATNRDLRQAVELGEFRRDLFYRLNVLHIDLPPLRERPDDIPLLVDAFVRQTSQEHDRPRVSLSPAAMRILMEYQWPGNVRELRNLMESMVVLAPGREITPDDVPPHVRSGSRGRALVPMPVSRPPAATDASGSSGNEDAGTSRQLEFLFRTLIDLRMNVEDLRREFDEYRREHPELAIRAGRAAPYGYLPADVVSAAPSAETANTLNTADVGQDGAGAFNAGTEEVEDDDDTGHVVFRPGMTMSDVEREAITAALEQAAGNRRQAAEQLGIGERTLYRKIKGYGIPL